MNRTLPHLPVQVLYASVASAEGTAVLCFTNALIIRAGNQIGRRRHQSIARKAVPFMVLSAS